MRARQQIPRVLACDDVIIPISRFTPQRRATYATRLDHANNRPAGTTEDSLKGTESWLHQAWVLIVEHSDIADLMAGRSMFDGFTIAGTRADVRFAFAGVDENDEEIAGWWFEPVSGQEKILDKAIVSVLVIND